MTPRACAAVVFLTVLAARVAAAGELAPGQSGQSDPDREFPIFSPTGDAPWYGESVAGQSAPFNFTHELEGGGPTRYARGTFTTRVLRDPETGRLAFEYELDQAETNAVNDLEQVYLRGFRSVSTDVYAFSNFREFGVSRSADGNEIGFGFNLEGIDGRFLVLTDATQFALRPAGFTVEMDFASAGSQASHFAAFAPIPEPSSAAALAAGAAGLLLRRARGRRPSSAPATPGQPPRRPGSNPPPRVKLSGTRPGQSRLIRS